MIRKTLCLLAALLLMPWAAFASDKPASPKEFVQAFYDWYVPLSAKGRGVPGSDYVFRKRASSFSPQIVKAIREDSAAQAKFPDEIVSLDGDAFLMCQDFYDRYVVGNVRKKGDSFFVTLHGMDQGVRIARPDVVAELRFQKGHWRFVNLYDKDGASLLDILKQLEADRRNRPGS